MLPELSRLLQYSNPGVLSRYHKDYPDNTMPAGVAMRELLKYMWLCQRHAMDRALHCNDESLYFTCVMHLEMREIDDMWHTFLLYTEEYHDFCNAYFGTYIHHRPFSEIEKEALHNRQEHELYLYLSYIYDHLGDETVKLWFNED